MNTILSMPEADPAHFLRIADQGATLHSHADLWRWLQGDVQAWLPHDIMVVGWGDLRNGDPQFDVVSSLPGLRTQTCDPTCVARLLSYVHDFWVAAQRAPCQPEVSGVVSLLGDSAAACPLGRAIGGMGSALVHGVGDGRHGGERIFVALGAQPARSVAGGAALKLLLPFIDTALRRMPPPPARPGHGERERVEALMAHLSTLSERERQIMVWVALGKTNPEIGCILHISEFTVKNHMKSIFAKLDVTNRAQAVAKLTRMSAYA